MSFSIDQLQLVLLSRRARSEIAILYITLDLCVMAEGACCAIGGLPEDWIPFHALFFTYPFYRWFHFRFLKDRYDVIAVSGVTMIRTRRFLLENVFSLTFWLIQKLVCVKFNMCH